MGLFSGKQEGEYVNSKGKKISKTLPDTLLQKISLNKQISQNGVDSKKIFTDDMKSSLQVKDEHKRLPESITQQVKEHVKEKGPERHELEKVIMIKKEFDDVAKDYKSANLPSFFAELERRIFERGLDRKHIVSQDIMERLKEYHDSLNKGNPFFLHELEIEDEIAKSLSSLKSVETEWLLTKRNVAIAEKILYEKEKELESKLEGFKGLLSSSEKFRKFNMVAEENKAFFLPDGTIMRTIQDLIQELPRMNDSVFYVHVTPEKNDFANWIRHVFGLEGLANLVLSAKTKWEILEVLRNY